MNSETTMLYRPVAPKELELIAASGYRGVEHTRNDRYWADGGDDSGKNRLGQLLMELRSELRRESSAGTIEH